MTKRARTIDDLEQTGEACLQFAARRGCRVRQNGSHAIATSPVNGEIAVIPVGHGGSGHRLPIGTFRSILKRFSIMLIACLTIAIIVGVLAV